MKTGYPSIPPGARSLIRDWEDLGVQSGKVERAARGRRDEKKHKVADIQPHRLYYLGLLPVVSGAGLESAVLFGWRHLTESSDGFVELTVENVSDRRFRVSRTRELAPDHLGAKAVRLLQHRSRLSKGHDEIRALTVPPLVSLAIWHRKEQSAKSRLIPIHSVVSELPVGKPVSEKQFLDAIRQPSRELLEFVPEHWDRNQKERFNKSRKSTATTDASGVERSR